MSFTNETGEGIARGILICAAVLYFGLWGAGCGREPAGEGMFYEEGPEPLQPSQMLKRSLDGVSEEAEAEKITRSSPAPDGLGAMEDWTRRAMDRQGGTVLFPRWQVRRLRLNQYEVTIEFTVVDDSNKISRLGYAWDADVQLKTVSAPRVIPPEEMESRTGLRGLKIRGMDTTRPKALLE